MSFSQVLKLPLTDVRRFLRLLRARDLAARLAAVQYALLTREAGNDEAVRAQQQMLDALLPELQEPMQLMPTAPLVPTRSSPEEERKLELLAQAGRFPVRKGNVKESDGRAND